MNLLCNVVMNTVLFRADSTS